MSIEVIYCEKPLNEAGKLIRDKHVIVCLVNDVTCDVAMSKAHSAFNAEGYRAIKVKGAKALNIRMPKGPRRMTFFAAKTRNQIMHMRDKLAHDPDVATQNVVLVASQNIPVYLDGRVQSVS